VFAEDEAHGRCAMIFCHAGLEAGRGNLFWAALLGTPLDQEAIGDGAKHAQDSHSIIILHPAAVIIIGDIQTLVQATFDAPSLAIEQEPEHRWQQCRRSTGD
jgi:hypothetical protein